jgi:hypothetical protein
MPLIQTTLIPPEDQHRHLGGRPTVWEPLVYEPSCIFPYIPLNIHRRREMLK